MDRIPIHTQMSPEDYLAWERQQAAKHEYIDGKVFAMAGGSPRHNALCGRLITALTLAHRGCAVLTSDQRVRMWGKKRYHYPDATVVCGAFETETNDVLVNPTIVVEVLSRSTEAEDRGTKWEGYRRIPSLADFLLVSQASPRIEHYQRAPDGRWIFAEAGPGGRIVLSTGAELVIDDLFDAATMALPGDSEE